MFSKHQKRLTPAPLQKMITGFWISKTLSVATELEIFTKVAHGLTTVDDITKALDTHYRPVEMLLNACTALELLRKEGRQYSNTHLAEEFLVKGKPRYFGDMILWFGNQLYTTWGGLKESILENKPQEEHERKLFVRDHQTAKAMTKAMHNNALGPAMALVHKFDFSPYNKLLDLGGGSGAYAVTITKTFSNVKTVMQDLPVVCEVAQEFIKTAGLEGRISTLAGNFFDIDLPGADVVLLAQLLHSYSVEECKIILQKVHECLRHKGKVIIVDFVLANEKTEPLFAALFSLNMLLRSDEGQAYSEMEIRSWLQETGFVKVETIELIGPVKAVIAEKP